MLDRVFGIPPAWRPVPRCWTAPTGRSPAGSPTHRVDRRPQVEQGGRFGLRLQDGEVPPSAVDEDNLRVPGDVLVADLEPVGADAADDE